ncbi:MAG: pseudouridine synthase [Candidatus Neomarinimicrobiota bacterium]
MRLNKFLSQSGIASRRKSDELIKMATTEVNGVICFDPAYDVKKSDVVKYDGKKISIIEKKIVIMLHKPKNIISTVSDTHDRKTVMDLIPRNIHLNPVGRLDKDTTGLLLLTNDGELHQYLTHPKNEIPKDYEVIIEGKLDQVQIKKIKKGIYIGHKEYGRAKVLNQETKKGRSRVVLQLRQGKKREVRRIFYRMGLKLLTLKRIKFSNLSLGNLKIGEFVKLNKQKIQLLKS